MAVSEQTPYIEYIANGIAKSFALEFDCENQDHLIVLVDEVEPVVGTWSLSNGAVVFGTAPVSGKKITIQRNTPFRRDEDFQSYDNSFRPPGVNKGFDKIWLKLQELGVADWLLGRKIQKFRDDVNLTALEETLERAREIRDDTAASVVEVQSNVDQSTILLASTIAKAEAAATSATNADTAKVQAEIAATDATTQASTLKIYVDAAVGAISTDASKQYATLALAEADISNIALNKNVFISEAVNGGYWYKATAGATTLTKSPYDAVEQAKSDATTKANAAEVNAKNYADLLDSKIGYYQTENILDPSQPTSVGYLLNGAPNGVNGSITALTYYSIYPNQKFWVRGSAGSNIVAVYDSNKKHIGNIDYNSAVNGVLTVASNYSGKTPAFIRLSLFGKTSLLDFEFGYGWLRPDNKLAYLAKYTKNFNENFTQAVGFDYIKTRPEILKDVIDTTVNDYYGKHLVKFENLINPNQDLIQGYYTDTGYATPTPTIPNFYLTTNFIPVPKSRKFWAKGLNFSATEKLVQLCDINKKPILATTTSVIGTSILTIPLTAGSGNSEVFYIRVGSPNGIDFIRNGGLSVGWLSATPPTIYPAYGAPYAILSNDVIQNVAERINVSNALLSKKWVAMGDSITAAANSYCDVIASRYSAILNKSHSKSEACIHRKTPEDTRLILSEEYLNIATENPPDIITIAAGTNDFVTGTPMSIGTMSDRTNTTFYGALHVLLSGLRARFPSTRIGFISQIPRGGTRYTQYDTTTSDKQKAVVMVCEYYSIPLWEGYKEFGFHPDDSDVMATNLMPDKLHPNAAGHIWYANRIEDFILSLAK